MHYLSKLKQVQYPATFALGVWIDDRPPVDSWEPPEEPETTVLLVDGNDTRHELSDELETALVGLVENHAGEICDALQMGTDHQPPPVHFKPVVVRRSIGDEPADEQRNADKLISNVLGHLNVLLQMAENERLQAESPSDNRIIEPAAHQKAVDRISYLRSAAHLLFGCYKEDQ